MRCPRWLPRAVLALAIAGGMAGCAVGGPIAAPRSPPTDRAASPMSTPSPSPARMPVIVTIGDSIMAGYGLAPGENWPAMLGSEEHVDIVNLGCPSAGFVAVGACGTNYAGLIAQAIASRPALVVIQSSSNDRAAQSDAAVAAATTDTITRLRDALPSTSIVGLSTLWGASEWQPDEVATSSSALRSAVEAQGGRFIDLGQPLRGHPEWMQADTIHPTVDGQRVLGAAVRSGLETAGVSLDP